MMQKPEPTEYAPYYGKYIDLVADGDIVHTLEKQMGETLALLASISEEQSLTRYAPDKWTIREMVGHVNDTERMFAYRALRISRGDQTPIEGFDQDAYVANGPSARIPLRGLAAEFADVRRATLSLFRQFDSETLARRGVANKNEVSVRALAWIAAGHELHHRSMLREKYRVAAA